MYKILSKIGAGAFGNVFLLQCSKYQYALKVVDERHASDDEDRGDILSLKLCHAHLVQCWDAFLYSNNYYFVLELCCCGSLEVFLERRKTMLSQERILVWFSQIADVLRYLQAVNVIHRDLKPDNIFLDEKEDLKVGDLGIARKFAFTEEYAKSMKGTWCYMSPEVHNGQPYNYKTDIWSMGCCIHEMMTLRRTFGGKSIVEMLSKIIGRTIPEMPYTYDRQLRKLVLSLLSNDPYDRPDALHILFILSKIRGKQLNEMHLKTDNREQFDQKKICQALEVFESASKSRKIIPLKDTTDETDEASLCASSFQKERDSSSSQISKFSKSQTAFRNVTSQGGSSVASEVVSFMMKLEKESLLWLQEHRRRHQNQEMPDRAVESLSVTISTKSQSASFLNRKGLTNTDSSSKKRKPKNLEEEVSLLVIDISISMMRLCQGQSKHLSEMMLNRVMGCNQFSKLPFAL